MARKPKPKVRQYKVETHINGKWLWVILPNFKTQADARAWITERQERERNATPYRVVETWI